MKEGRQTFCIEMSDEVMNDPEKRKKFQELMGALQEAHWDGVAQTEITLGVSEACAVDIEYLRTRSRWNQEMENELIRLHSIGEPPNICDWPPQDSPLRN